MNWKRSSCVCVCCLRNANRAEKEKTEVERLLNNANEKDKLGKFIENGLVEMDRIKKIQVEREEFLKQLQQRERERQVCENASLAPHVYIQAT